MSLSVVTAADLVENFSSTQSIGYPENRVRVCVQTLLGFLKSDVLYRASVFTKKSFEYYSEY